MKQQQSQQFTLLKQASRIVLRHPLLYLYPLISSLISFGLLYYLLHPYIHHAEMRANMGSLSGLQVALIYIVTAAFLFATHVILYTFLSGLLTYCQDLFMNKATGLFRSFRLLFKNAAYIFGWLTFASTVGFCFLLFHPLLKNLPWYQRLFKGLPWRIACFFSVEVAVFERKNPLATLRRSVELIQQWHPYPRPTFRFNKWFLLARLIALLPLLFGLFHDLKAFFIYSLVSILLLLLLRAYQRTLYAIAGGALYFYATKGQAPPGYSEELLARAFAPGKPPAP